jgi:hypothetical protein
MRMSGADRIPVPGSAAAEDDIDVLRRERDQALAHARKMEHEIGVMRGQVERLERIMWRKTARREWAAAWVERVRRLARR